MQHEEFSVNKEESIAKNIDATGKKWDIVSVRGLGLYQVKPMDDRVKVPEEIGGKWTKREWLQERIDLFLKKSWDTAQKTAVKQERAAQAQKEAPKKEK